MKNKNSSKGFTLVELLAVMIILVAIILIALNAVRKNVDKTLDNTIVANAGMFIKGVNSFTEVESISNSDYDEGIFSVTDLMSSGVKISGTKPDDGYVLLDDSEVVSACLVYGEYSINCLKGSCDKPVEAPCSTLIASYEFDYTGGEKSFETLYNGTYVIETWGAQGGGTTGGYGGYSIGSYHLNKGDTVYVNVGGAGANLAAGYNGGGGTTSSGQYYGGGGASHVALDSGVLSTLNGNIDKIIIVAAGGGGTSPNNPQGGHGGGIQGVNGKDGACSSKYGFGGTQTEPGKCAADSSNGRGSFGQGGVWGSGGGGGYWGGGGGTSGGCYGSGGGGSGYIANSLLTNKSMYCYDCIGSNDESTKTVSTTCVEETPIENCAKKGNGFVRISLSL